MINDLLFVYGSLLHTANEFANHLKNNAILCCTGKLKGKLYDLGEYPGAIADAGGNQYVFGSVYQLIDPEKDFLMLDDYEGFGATQKQPNLFIRKLIAIESETGMMECWAYLYNLPIDGLPEITSGNYLNYLNQKNIQ